MTNFPPTDKPFHTHDCDACTFLGWAIDGTPGYQIMCVDLYVCGQEFPTASLIARFSSEPSDYSSRPISAGQPKTMHLLDAYHRARGLGYID